MLHPVVVTAVIANAGAALWGSLQGLSYAAAQKVYLAKARGGVKGGGPGRRASRGKVLTLCRAGRLVSPTGRECPLPGGPAGDCCGAPPSSSLTRGDAFFSGLPPSPRAQGAGPLGAGDLLMSLLGVVIISFGFRVYTQRDTMQRHFPEIVGATVLSSVFSLFSTAFAAKAVGLGSGAPYRGGGGARGRAWGVRLWSEGRERRGCEPSPSVWCLVGRARAAGRGSLPPCRNQAACSSIPSGALLGAARPKRTHTSPQSAAAAPPPPRHRAGARADPAQRDRRAGAAYRAEPRGAARHHRCRCAAPRHPGAPPPPPIHIRPPVPCHAYLGLLRLARAAGREASPPGGSPPPAAPPPPASQRPGRQHPPPAACPHAPAVPTRCAPQGANFGPGLMTAVGIKDTIAR